MNDYDRVAEIIRYLGASHTEQPDLSTLASRSGLSAAHFHRLFSGWAGVTPKDFLQSLTLRHAKVLLREGASVLDTALDVGLSGPGRLHDLCVSLEAASPGEVKSGGADWTITAGFAESPFGTCLIAENARGICHLSFVDAWADRSVRLTNQDDKEAAAAAIGGDWPRARIRWDNQKAAQLVRAVFARGRRGEAPNPKKEDERSANLQEGCQGPKRSTNAFLSGRGALRVFVRGSAFQVRVWRALLQIPAGALTSYKRLAAAVGCPSAARAVGSAVAANTLAYLIPCHRVIRETGVIGEYRWGNVRKRAIIAWESRRARE